jgi:hypothetical protein
VTPADDPPAESGYAGGEPVLRVVKGDPTPEELAALVAVVASLGGPAAPTARRMPVWNAPARLQRRVLRPGLGAWRGSGLPPA